LVQHHFPFRPIAQDLGLQVNELLIVATVNEVAKLVGDQLFDTAPRSLSQFRIETDYSFGSKALPTGRHGLKTKASSQRGLPSQGLFRFFGVMESS
jgi:hypothetical protein